MLLHMVLDKLKDLWAILNLFGGGGVFLFADPGPFIRVRPGNGASVHVSAPIRS